MKNLKKRFVVLALAAMVICTMVLPVSAQGVNVSINGQNVYFPDQQPYIDSNSRTLVPMRQPMEAMGCTVEWNAEKQQAIIKNGEKTVIFTIGSDAYQVNDLIKTMNTQAVITGGRTCIPIRYAAEAFGATVNWDGITNTVVIHLLGDDYNSIKGYIIPVKKDVYVNTTQITDNSPVITITLDSKDRDSYLAQIEQACSIIASKHGSAITAEMRSTLQSKDDIYDVLNWSQVTADGIYKIEISNLVGHKVDVKVYSLSK